VSELFAAVLDPGDDGINIDDLLIILTIVAAVCGLVATAWKGSQWLKARLATRRDRRRRFLVDLIDERLDDRLAHWTKPIQPEANGGSSLPDAAGSAHRAELLARAIVLHLNIPVDDLILSPLETDRDHQDP